MIEPTTTLSDEMRSWLTSFFGFVPDYQCSECGQFLTRPNDHICVIGDAEREERNLRHWEEELGIELIPRSDAELLDTLEHL